MTKIILTLIVLLANKAISQEYVIISNGKRTYSFKMNIAIDKTRTILKNESTFTDSDGDYGISTCIGTLERLNKQVEYNLKCEGINQNNEKYWATLYRKSNENQAGIGSYQFTGGTGKYEEFKGKSCSYAIRYFSDEIFFFRLMCK